MTASLLFGMRRVAACLCWAGRWFKQKLLLTSRSCCGYIVFTLQQYEESSNFHDSSISFTTDVYTLFLLQQLQ